MTAAAIANIDVDVIQPFVEVNNERYSEVPADKVIATLSELYDRDAEAEVAIVFKTRDDASNFLNKCVFDLLDARGWQVLHRSDLDNCRRICFRRTQESNENKLIVLSREDAELPGVGANCLIVVH